MTSSPTHRKCAFCGAVAPIHDTACPRCAKSFEPHGPLGRALDAVLPDDRPVTKLIVGAAVAAFAMMGLVAGGTALIAPSVYTVIHFGALFPPYLVEGQLWRLITTIFLHGDLMHIGFNLYGLWVVGPLIERSFGKARYLVAFLVSGVVASLCSAGWSSVALKLASTISIPFIFNPDTVTTFSTPSVGMSGALTGLIGVGIAAGHKVNNASGQTIRDQLVRWMGMIVLFGLIVPGVDNAAHIGGFVAGLGLGFLFPLKDRARRLGGLLSQAAAAACLLAIVASFALHVRSMPLQYPADLDLYPTQVFGNTLRQSNPKDPVVASARTACFNAQTDLENLPPNTKPSPKLRATLLEECHAIRTMEPMNPAWYLTYGVALHHNGDTEGACTNLSTAQLMLDRGLRPSMGKFRDQLVPLVAKQLDAFKCPH